MEGHDMVRRLAWRYDAIVARTLNAMLSRASKLLFVQSALRAAALRDDWTPCAATEDLFLRVCGLSG